MTAARQPIDCPFRRTPLPSLLACLLLAVMLCLAGSGRAWAASPDFLSVDQAFAVHVERVDGDHVAVVWQIADGYYLYRHALKLTLLDGAGHPVQSGLRAPDIPSGDRHDDEFFGPVETYRHRLRVTLIAADGKTFAPANRLRVSYQGCADAGLCYPPQTRTVEIPPPRDISNGTPAADSQTAAGLAVSTAHPPVNATDQAHALLTGSDSLGRLIWTLLAFFGFGILLAFTPCILPMIPILAGLIVGQADHRGSGRRSLALSAAYVVAMALAYTVFGVVAGYFGANIQAALQTPWVILPFAGLFLLLAAASFGWFELALPGVLRERAGRIGVQRHSLAGAALMGFFSALVVGPCLAPPLAGALAYISTQGSAVLGGSALFVLGLGMGVPLVAMATLGPRVLPARGAWMGEIRVFFGVLLIAVAVWLAARVVSSQTSLLLWGALALAYGGYLSTRRTTSATAQTSQRVVVFLLWGYAGLAGTGLAIGGGYPAAPLAGLSRAFTRTNAGDMQTTDRLFVRTPDSRTLQRALAEARSRHQPAVVDFYADWCVECVRMAHGLFTEPAVRRALADVAAIQVDVTAYDADDRRMLKRLGVFGPPTLLLIPADGDLRHAVRLVGTMTSDQLRQQLRILTAAS